MVDTVKILGALLGGGKMSAGSGSDILKNVLGAAVSGKGGAGLEDLLGSVLGGQKGGSSAGGLEDILGSVLGGGARQGGQGGSSGGGLGDILGSVLGGGSSGSSNSRGSSSRRDTGVADIGDLLGGVLGGGESGGSGGLGDLIGAALNQYGDSEKQAQSGAQPRRFEEHSPGISHNAANDQAALMIRAMVNAAKSDGRLDQEEQENITGNLGHVSRDEIEFINKELARPLDVEAFARTVPAHLANQVYAMSLTAIDLDTNKEATYLHELGQGMGISTQTINQIHAQVGAPALYA